MHYNILRHLPASINKIHRDIYPVRACGCWIYDNTNRKYLDLTSGIGALSTGHSHPKIIEKAKKQLDSLVHIPQQVFKSHPAQIELTYKLLNIMPCKSLNNIFYVNSGSEATDNAIKIARHFTQKTNIITMKKGFHGRSLGALSITSSNVACKYKLQPLMSGIFFCHDFTKQSLDDLLTYNTSPDETAAIILEPVQGEAGIFSISKDFMKYVEKICHQYNIMLIADEVQCGAGRTGDWWNVNQKNITPDIMTFGKGIASGFPLAGVVSRSQIMNSIPPGSLGGTYGGNAVASIVASETIDIIQNEKLLNNANNIGNIIYQEIINLNCVKDVRQYGLMIAIDFGDDYGTTSRKIISALRDENILVLSAGYNGQYIRLLPPLNINEEEISLFLEKFKLIVNVIL